MDLSTIFWQLGIALGLGLLVGLQRERANAKLAGMRTFPLAAVLGTVCGLLGQAFGGWILATGFVALAAIIVMGNITIIKSGKLDPGLTTEIALLLMFAVGAYLVVGYREVAIAIGGLLAVLLHFKGQLHSIADRLGDDDLKAIMQFVLISLVILPVLPNRTYGPFDVLNPRQIWLMVVLIVGIGSGGFIAYKFLGERAGVLLGGFLGGLISSTATTVSYARLTRVNQESRSIAAVVVMIASAIVFLRMILEVAVVAPAFLAAAAPPLAAMFVILLLLAIITWRRNLNRLAYLPSQENPSELKSAIMFGVLYAVVLFAVAAARTLLDPRWLYVIAGLSGVTDVDAITLSTSQLVNAGRLDPETGWRIILIASMANLLSKGLIVMVLGHDTLLKRIAPMYLVSLLSGVILLGLWSFLR